MSRIILRGAKVFDVTARRALAGVAVVVEGDRIADVVPSATVGDPGSARVVDLTGCTLLPGLVDLHVHLGWGSRGFETSPASMALRAARNASAAQAAGITTLRDVGTTDGVAIAVRDAVVRGDISGSRVVPCGRILCMTGGHGSEPRPSRGWPARPMGPTTAARRCANR